MRVKSLGAHDRDASDACGPEAVPIFARSHWLVRIDGQGNLGQSRGVQLYAYQNCTPDVAMTRAFSDWCGENCGGDEDNEICGGRIYEIRLEPIVNIV